VGNLFSVAIRELACVILKVVFNLQSLKGKGKSENKIGSSSDDSRGHDVTRQAFPITAIKQAKTLTLINPEIRPCTVRVNWILRGNRRR
jgi:hypothetical protein